MPDTLIPTDDDLSTPSHFKEFVARITKGDDPNGPDVVATVTCDSVDADNEVVLPDGADLSRYVKAPRIQLCHAYGRPGEYYPLPVGKALWTKRQGRALVQGIRFSRTSAMGREVAGLFMEDMLNTFSIGFQSLEASPPTKEEKRLHPEWANADLIHRRWKLLEVSVVPIPSNEDAIGQWVRKGKRVPSFLWIPNDTNKGGHSVDPIASDDDLTAANGNDEPGVTNTTDAETKALDSPEPPTEPATPAKSADPAFAEMKAGLLARHSKILHSGKAGDLYAHPETFAAHHVRHADDDDQSLGYHSAAQVKAMLGSAPHVKSVTVDSSHPDEGEGYERLHPPPAGFVAEGMDMDDQDKALAEGSGSAGGYTVETDSPLDKEMDVEPDETESYTPEPGHVVKFPAHHGMHGGCGEVKSVHRKGKVPDVINEAMASDDEPHARVELFKARGAHLYERTGAHVGIHVKHLSRMPMLACDRDHKSIGDDAEVKRVVPYRAGPISDEPWDADAAKKRVAKWASRDGSGSKESMDWSRYEQAFALCDPAKHEDFEGYRLPHHDVKNGKLVVVKAGVRAALAALGGARGGMSVSAEDKAGAERHLHKHEAEWGGGEESEEKADEKSAEPTLSRIPPFKTRAQYEAKLKRQAMANIAPETIQAQVEQELAEKIFGAV